MNQPKINLGILAHVDAGKTTVTEQFLYASGVLRSAGSVDKGTSATDTLDVERSRGISVRAATAVLEWKGHRINIIDTPGHVDFSSEVERSLRALDAALLVVCAVDGVQAFTLTLFRALRAMRIPTLIFINKLDRAGADVEAVLQELHRECSPHCSALQAPLNEGSASAAVESLWSEEIEPPQHLVEAVAETDDLLLDRYFDDAQLKFPQLDDALVRACHDGRIFPVLMGVARSGTGIEDLLDTVVHVLPSCKGKDTDAFSAVVFKIEHDARLGKMASLRLFRGTLTARDKMINATRSEEEKAGQLKAVEKGRYVDLKSVAAGDVVVVSGLAHAHVGDIYGETTGIAEPYVLSTTLLTVRVRPHNDAQFNDLVHALSQLSREDPTLAMDWLPDQRELHINITGMIQLEILETVLRDRYDLAVSFDDPTVIYKETPSGTATGFERYWMPKPCWAILELLIEPGSLGSGVVYQSEVSLDDIALRYQNEIRNTIPKAVKQGIKGWEVTDLKITLIKGEDHNVHTRAGDFITATPMALMNGLTECGTTLLEPILSFTISAPVSLLGSVTSDITKMRGTFDGPEIKDERFALKGKIPAATSMDYPVQLASRSGGKAKITTRLHGYEPCTDEQGRITPYRGISPSDREQWILQARGALKR